MTDRIKVTSNKNIDFRLHYKTFAEYYPVERLQNFCWLYESKLLRILGIFYTERVKELICSGPKPYEGDIRENQRFR